MAIFIQIPGAGDTTLDSGIYEKTIRPEPNFTLNFAKRMPSFPNSSSNFGGMEGNFDREIR